MIGNKKVHDVQFFKEAGNLADYIDLKTSKRKLNDMDELEQEQRERE
jgi:nucleosome binding factor SPN SPT16 subunit